jgi:pyruvate dehydrogenase E2 component (dihydrolipoamide acetyltransferase)
VKSLALIAPAGLGQSINREYIQGFVAAANHRQLKPLMHLLFADERLVTRQLVEEALRYKRLEGVGEALTKIATNRFGETSTGGQLRDVVGCVPTLIIWGGRDRVIPAPTAAEFSGPDVVFRVLPEHGHMVQIEAAAEVNRLIEAHLAR